jgi:transcriptional regulator with XRE-family HTH domain
MLTLRDALGLTQAALAGHLGVSRRAVGDWEAGNKYPKVDHLKELIALAVERGAFTAGRETDEIQALWRAAHQRVLLDEAWLTAILSQRSPRPGLDTSAGVRTGPGSPAAAMTARCTSGARLTIRSCIA